MSPLELADKLRPELSFVSRKHAEQAGEVIRRQHETIVMLRGALVASVVGLNIGHNTLVAIETARQALADTENL